MVNKMNIDLSVIIPVYNVKPYLKDCLNSLNVQTARNVEFILVDDGSTDGSAELLDSFANTEKRARVIHLPQNMGTAYARQVGITAACSKFTMFVDSDDFLTTRNVLSELINLANEANADLVQFSIKIAGNDAKAKDYFSAVFSKTIHGVTKGGENILKQFFSSEKNCVWALFNKIFLTNLLKKCPPQIPAEIFAMARMLFFYFLIAYYAKVLLI